MAKNELKQYFTFFDEDLPEIWISMGTEIKE